MLVLAASAKLKTISKNKEKSLNGALRSVKAKKSELRVFGFFGVTFFCPLHKNQKKVTVKITLRWESGNKKNPTLGRGSKENLKSVTFEIKEETALSSEG
jgi:hypothetical protein